MVHFQFKKIDEYEEMLLGSIDCKAEWLPPEGSDVEGISITADVDNVEIFRRRPKENG